MGLNIGFSQAANNDLTIDSAAGVYQSEDGSIAIKGDSNGKKRGDRPSLPATQVTVTSAKSGRTFIKDIEKCKDNYTYLGSLSSFKLVKNQ